MNALKPFLRIFVAVLAMSATAAVACFELAWVTKEVAGFAVVGAAIAILFGEAITQNFIWRGIWPIIGGAVGSSWGDSVSGVITAMPAYQALLIIFGVVVGAVGFGSLFVFRRVESEKGDQLHQAQIDGTNGYRFTVWASTIGLALGVLCAIFNAIPFDEKPAVLWDDSTKLVLFGFIGGLLCGLPHLLAWLVHCLFARTKK